MWSEQEDAGHGSTSRQHSVGSSKPRSSPLHAGFVLGLFFFTLCLQQESPPFVAYGKPSGQYVGTTRKKKKHWKEDLIARLGRLTGTLHPSAVDFAGEGQATQAVDRDHRALREVPQVRVDAHAVPRRNITQSGKDSVGVDVRSTVPPYEGVRVAVARVVRAHQELGLVNVQPDCRVGA